MPTIDVNGTTLGYDDTGGDGPAVVLSHSLSFDRTVFAAQVARFGRTYRVIAYDHRNHGESASAGTVDVDALAADAAALVEALALGPCHFVGDDTGGHVALRLVARRPELLRSAAVLSSSADEENFPALREEAVHGKSILGELVGATVPLLVLSGDHDSGAPELSQRIADTAANACHLTVRGAGHALVTERPDLVNDLLAEHFAAT